ncbi:UbiD family decarboxylase [Pigmentiphaga sp. H8]|uniref:UbiD family decarboxylase n=1 Tax=Pigmentiphaga sp. H8 TaxID=2488560 RepID=UPI000F5AAEF5|nr:UbiD family decarboxylase [Pigmentiphaga sp. H8]AZG11006.1 UbiD family decarboxylase [Pigmentiphaga sp. H8]
MQKTWNDYDRPHQDLRELLERVDKAGELLRVSGADWNLEVGTLAEIIHGSQHGEAPAILFDNIPGYPAGFRLLSGASNSSARLALTLGFPVPRGPMDVVQSYRDRMQRHEPIPPRVVETGPILENIDRDDDVDIFKFPVPFLHELDGGRYIGTDDLVIMRDPELDWINIGTYRSMAHSRNQVGLWTSPGKQGRQIRDKYFKQGKPCPVLISCGHDPMLFLAGGNELRFGLSEYDYSGGHRGLPFDVVLSEVHKLPMPAHSEIVLEGEMYPDDTLPEGPFGEFTGYYAGGKSNQPVVRIQRVYYRNDPILTMATPLRPPSDFSFSKCVMKAGMIWDEVERAGLSGVKGVWCHEAGAARLFNIISIKQAYAGHARQAAMLAANCQSGSYLGRFVVVVDEDVDPTNLFDVVWAMSTRCDPVEDIEFIRKAWSGPLDPRIPRGTATNSRAVIDACRPFEMLKDFPPVACATPELRQKVEAKFADLLAKLK